MQGGVSRAAWPDILSLSPATDTPYSSKPLQQTPASSALSVRADVDLTILLDGCTRAGRVIDQM